MTQENKAKAFDEALERARKILNMILDNELLGFPDQIREIFPQLKESDDERIRKDIIDHFESIKSRALYDNQEESDNIISSCNEKIAYLEKQKEPKVDIDKLRRDLYQSGYNDGYQHGKEDAQKEQKSSIVEKLRKISTPADEDWFEIQKQWEKEDEQKPDTRDADDLQLLGFIYDLLNEIEWKDNWAMSKDECLQRLNNYRPQKLVEWSEEDKHNLSSVINLVHATTNGAWGSCIGDRIENWLKNLPERFVLQLNQEWSEEDKMMRENIISDLRYFKDCATDEEAVSDYDDEINWLKDISLNHKKFIEAVDKLWSNEWSEEDKRMLSRCIKSVECSKQFADSETYKVAKDAEMNWLEFLPKRKNLPPKQEWSEEDKQMIDLAVDAVEDFYNGGIRSKIINLLKSLHPSWKPSKKQMDALKNIAYGAYQNGDGPALRELHEQLLKLGVKKNEKI